MITVYSPPATEPLTIAEVMSHLRLDASNQEPAPTAPTVALLGTPIAGNMDNGVHRYLVTFVTSVGETQSGDISDAVTVADKTVNGKVSITAIPLGGSLVTARKIYRTVSAGTQYLLLTTIADNTTTTYTDNIADASLGAEAPSINTTIDPQITMMIKAARQAAELELHRYLITQTVDLYLDHFPWCFDSDGNGRTIYIPPIQTVSEITYVDSNGATQTLPTVQYVVDVVSNPARITEASGYSWPYTRVQNNAVKVRFIAGYGAASAVPECIKHWMLLKIVTMWESREQFITGTSFNQLPVSYIDSLLDPERVTGRV